MNKHTQALITDTERLLAKWDKDPALYRGDLLRNIDRLTEVLRHCKTIMRDQQGPTITAIEQTLRAARATIIRQALKDRDLSLSWLARRLGTSPQYVTAATRPPFTELSEAFFKRCQAVYSKVPVIVGQGKR